MSEKAKKTLKKKKKVLGKRKGYEKYKLQDNEMLTYKPLKIK